MPWRRFGVPIAAIVLLFAVGRITAVVVDWAWFSSIGYVGVFWTAFATKAALFVVVFAVSALALCAMRSKVRLKVSASLLKLASFSIEVESPDGRQGGELPPGSKAER